MGRLRKVCTRSSISPHSRDTWLLEMPSIPMARTRSSTERVEMRCGPLKPGDEIAASFTLIFADTDPVAGREVVKALHDLAELTTSILETFEAHCEASE